MLDIIRNRQEKCCDGVSRRGFLRIGTLSTALTPLGIANLSLSDLTRIRATTSKQQSNGLGKPTKSTSVVWLWLGGGPTHIETFDPKMTAPVEFRSVTGAIPSKVPGMEFGGTFSKMAQVADKMALVRSFAHRNSGHGGGTHWVMTGHNFVAADNGGGQKHPGIGSIMSHFRGLTTPTGLPSYVRFRQILGDGPAWLGPSYSPFDVQGKAKKNMQLRLRGETLDERKTLLKELDRFDRQLDKSGAMKGMDSFEQQAFELIMSKSKDVFDLKNENQKIRDLYGKGLGEELLIARRLCEAGVGFVTIHYGGWDMHGGIEKAMKSRGQMLDHAVSTFIADCAQRGLDQDILLVITGEFGRTPRINKGAGRDHWAPLSTLALAGGGLKMGQVVGQSSSKAEIPKSAPISPQDLMATVFHVLGIPQELKVKDPTGRPTPFIDGGKPIAELI